MAPNHRLLHEHFTHIATLFPDHVAVSTDARDIRYSELETSSTRIAKLLVRLGIQREDVVAVYLDKGIEFVATILGVMKSGGVFLPLDLGLPAKRLAYMLGKTPPKVVITCRNAVADVMACLMEGSSVPVVYLEPNGELSVGDAHADPSIFDGLQSQMLPPVDPKDASYIVYTSGSTGNPKAVVGVHQSLSHFMHWEAKEFGVHEHTRVSQFPPVSFDASLKDIFVPLVAGGRVCIPPRSVFDSGANMVDWVARQQITLMHCVPALFRLILRELEERGPSAQHLPALVQVIIAGDVLFASDVFRWRACMGRRAALANLYGLTETTVLKTFHRIDEIPENPREIIHVGKPISNTAVLVVKGDKLCEIGQIGEIYIKSPFLTRGYLDDEPTNNRFVPNPLTRDPNEIVFKTGDLGRYRNDRSIELLGRLDNQVKVQGNRVELSEIEKNLLAFDAIDQTVVIALRSEDGEHTLACYYTEKRQTSSNELRAYLRGYLPDYMIPSFFVVLDKFPLNINGKIDRKALPKPEQMIYGTTGYVAPQNDTERGLENIWKDVLGLDRVSVTAPFFELGGHSLKATRVVSRIGRTFHVDLTLATFFANDTIRKLASLIDDATAPACPSIDVQAQAETYPASHAQYRLWVLDQMDENRLAYSMPGAYLFEGELDQDVLRQVFANLVARHESLRTTFEYQDGELRQRVHPELPGGLTLETIDLRGKSNDVSDDEGIAAQIIRQDSLRPFDIRTGPLVRMTLVCLAQDRYVLMLNLHHIIGDGWSVDVLGREWMALYEARAAGKPNPLPPLAIQYRDYVAWQNKLLNSEEGRSLGAYWRNLFARPVAPLELPVDAPRPHMPSYRGSTLRMRLNPDLARQWTAFAKARNATMFQTLTALVMVLLHRHTHQEDIVVGTPVAGRAHPDLESQVGFFVNMLALRASITSTDKFDSILERVKRATVEAYDHQNYPFDRLVDELALKRQANRAPLFDVMVAFETLEYPEMSTSNIRIREIEFDTGTTRYDLSLVFVAQDGGLEIKTNFNTDVFASDRIARLGQHLETLMRGVVTTPDQAIASLDLLPPAERRLVLAQYQGTQRPYPLERTLVELFADQVKAAPNRLALIYESVEITYGELYRRAATLAQRLTQGHDLQPGDRIGLMVDRGKASVIGLLGILMAGGVFLPLDPVYPRERIEYMLAQSQCRLVLAQSNYLASCGSVAKVVEYTDTPSITEDVMPPDCRDPRAAVIFTSGSTGRPKGILLAHKGIVNMARALIETFSIGPDDRVLQFAAYSFDIFLAEVWMTLLSGACLVVADRKRIDEPDAFLSYLQDKNVTVGSMPSAYLNALNRPPLSSFRVLITGGEAPNVGMAKYHAARSRYFNAYGLTEASAYSTLHEVDPSCEYPRAIPIGSPLPNTRLYILDEAMQPQPIGHTGEIYLGGAGVAISYINDSGLMEGRFVADPFIPGERLYRTGDFGRWLANGHVEFFGRSDNQVKVRGYRVEIDEIERTILEYPGVRDCAVTQVAGSGELAVYWIGADESADETSLRRHLAKTLPDFMMPTYYLRSSSFPLSSTGKIDKAALPDPLGFANENRSVRPANSAMERRLHSIWEKVLGVHHFGIDDNFFMLGGHSIHVVKLVSQLEEVLGTRVSPKQVYLHPTLAELARALETSSHVLPANTLTNTTHAASPSTGSPIERRPLLSLMAAGVLPSVDAVALDYLSDDLAPGDSSQRSQIIEQWCGGLPVFAGIRELPMGRIGFITLPRFGAQLFDDSVALELELRQALHMAAWIGAKAVSLTGLLTPATDYGRLLQSIVPHGRKITVTTGHATVVATMLSSLQRLLDAAGRRLQDERVAFMGLGSIGAGLLGLVMNTLGHPAELLLFDPHRDTRAFAEMLHYEGPLRVFAHGPSVPDEFYDASLIISATHADALLDVDRMAPATLLLTDSGRHGFDMNRALERLQRSEDILVTEGDLLRLGTSAPTTWYLPDYVESALGRVHVDGLLQRDTTTITGCVLSALLTAKRDDIEATTGPVTVEAAQLHRTLLADVGVSATTLHVGSNTISESTMAAFRARYGREYHGKR